MDLETFSLDYSRGNGELHWDVDVQGIDIVDFSFIATIKVVSRRG
jgi:hypothetical protein